MGTAAGKEIHVRDYGSAMWKHKWLTLSAFAGVVAPVISYIIWIQQPTYEATAALMVKVQAWQAELFSGARQITKINVDTEIEIMKSPPVVAAAASMLEAAGLDPERWIRKMTWTRIGETSVVHITAETPSAELSRDIANAVGKNYIDYSRRTMLDTSRATFVWLERQLAEAKARMQRDEQKLQGFRRANPDVSPGTRGEFDDDYHRALMADQMKVQLAGLTAETEMEEYGRLLDQCGVPRPGPPDAEAKVIAFDDKADPEKLALLAALSNSERLAQISADIDATKAAFEQQLKVLGPRHPTILEYGQHLATLQGHYEAAFLAECQKAYIRRRAHLSAMQLTLKQKARELEEYRRKFFHKTNEQLQYAVLQRNVEASRMLHNTVLAKLKEFDLSQGAAEESARFIQRAPVGFLKDPQNGIKIAFATLCGIVLGAGAALLMEYFDTTLKTVADVERTLDLAVLGTLPRAAPAAPAAPGLPEDNSGPLVVLD